MSSQEFNVSTNVPIPHLDTWDFETLAYILTTVTLKLKSYMAWETYEEFFRMSS